MMSTRYFDNRGSALLISLALMVILSLMAIMSADRATTDIEMSFNDANSQLAFYVADAGLKHALVVLNDSITWRAGFIDKQFGDGLYSVSLIDSVAQPGLDDTVIVVSLGSSKGASASIQAVVIPRLKRIFEYAVFADARLRMEDFSCTDSYNSDSGTYAATQIDSMGGIGTNGELELQDDVTISGDVFVASGGSVDIDPTVTVLGSVITDQPPVVIDPIPDSEFDWAIANNSAPAGFSGSGYSYSGGDLKIDTSGTLTLAGGVYYFTDIELENLGTITVAPGEQVIIYIDGDIRLEDNSSINIGGKPENFQVFSLGASNALRLEDNSQFWGVFYGPDAEFIMQDNVDVYGSVVASRNKVEVGAVGHCIHYDRGLMDYGKGAPIGMDLIAWREQ